MTPDGGLGILNSSAIRHTMRTAPAREDHEPALVRMQLKIGRHLVRSILVASMASAVADATASAEAGAAPAAQQASADPWELLAAGETAAASRLFTQALVRNPRSAPLHLGLGVAAFAERRDEDARAALSRALELDAELTLARKVLGLVLYRLGELDAAIAAYDMLLAATPDDAVSVETLARWQREASARDRMTVTAGSSFNLSFEGPPDGEIATRARESMERATTRIGQVLSAYPLTPIHVVLYTGEQFRDITRAPQWAGGAYDGTIRIPVRNALLNEKELDRVIAHEFTHALIRSLAPRGVPVWLDEGLATALEHPDWESIDQAVPAVAVPLGALIGSFGRFDEAQARAAYAMSAFAARRLLEEAGGFAVANLLRDLGAGAAFAEAFEHRIQRPLREFEAGFDGAVPRR
jgi:tetratricopeptide (TPR) repeat protein